MKRLSTLLLMVFFGLQVTGQEGLFFDPELAPFYHGVASGDPLSDRVIIWTRVTTDQPSVDGEWRVATDTSFANVVATGTFTTDASRDYTVKVDVTGLSPATTYYYVFEAAGSFSLIGRTKTAPEDEVDHLKFALVSCSNYTQGYFNAYGRLADRNDLDAIFHVGDYIYEYDNQTYSSALSESERRLIPDLEIVSLEDYRGRYSQYRLDPDLQRVHQQHPFIATWDDHEITNNTYNEGAENHQPETEGDFFVRKAAAKQAYFEWLPIRENEEETLYRDFSYGELADIIVLDTRNEDRTIQPTSMLQSDFNDLRTLLGEEQKAWLFAKLKNSTARWKIIPQQVMFSQLNVGFAADGSQVTNPDSVFAVENLFIDSWDGYPAERQQILDTILSNDIDNIVILSGDVHSAFASDLTTNPVLYPLPEFNFLPIPSPTYNPLTGEGSAAVEFVCPSITSNNFDEAIGAAATAQFEFIINNPFELVPGQSVNYNPHIKFNDLDRNGYVIVDIKPDSVQGDYYFVEAIKTKTDNENFEVGLSTRDGANHLTLAAAASAPKPVQDIPAPAAPSNFTAKVQIIHNAKSLPVEILANGATLLSKLAYRTATPYVEVPASEPIQLQINQLSGFNPISLDLEVTLARDKSYVIVAHGTFDENDDFPVGVSIFEGGREMASTGENVDLLFFHGSPDAPEVDITTGNSVVFDNVSYTNFSSDYVSVPAAPEYILDVTPAEDNNTIVASYSARLAFWKGKTAVVFASEFLGDGSFEPWVALSNGGTFPLSPASAQRSIVDVPAVNSPSYEVPASKDVAILSLFPNPTGDFNTVRFMLNRRGRLAIHVVDINGKIVRNIFEGENAAGAYKLEQGFADLPSGTYFYRIGFEGQVVSRKFIKQ